MGSNPVEKEKGSIRVQLELPAELVSELQRRADSEKVDLGRLCAVIVQKFAKYPTNDIRGLYLSDSARTEIELALGQTLQTVEELPFMIRDAMTLAVAFPLEDPDRGTKRMVCAAIQADVHSMRIISSRNYEGVSMKEFIEKEFLARALEKFVNGAF